MPSPLDDEALFVAVGLGSILASKPAMHKYKLTEAADLSRVIRKRLLAFLAADSFKPAAEMPPFDYQETLATVSAGQTPEQVLALMQRIPDPELAHDLALRADGILKWAFGIVPRETRAPGFGSPLEEPDASSIADFRLAWTVAEKPMVVLDDLEDGSLSADQVATLALIYPAIYGEMKQAAREVLATMQARRGKSWEPAPGKGTAMGVLLQQDTLDVELATEMQQIFAQDAAEKAPPPKPTSAGAQGTQPLTPGQKQQAG